MRSFIVNPSLLVCGILSLALSLLPAVCHAEDMVEIAVEITEINNNKAQKLGVKWVDALQIGEVMWDQAGRIPTALPEVPSLIAAGDFARYTALTADLRLLLEKGAARILSQPKILTRSGTSARFLVGGEIPVVAEGLTYGSIEWKQYGLKTEILPKIQPDAFIELTLSTEVSRLDWANQVKGIPALVTRKANSSVRMKPGQTIALAGMVETTNDEKRSGIPLLGDLPVLGYLFSRRDTVETKSNIIIFVTPRIVE